MNDKGARAGPRLPGHRTIDWAIGAGAVMLAVLHIPLALYLNFYLTDGWEIPKIVRPSCSSRCT